MVWLMGVECAVDLAVWEDMDASQDHVRPLLKSSLARGADVALVPEMFAA